MRIIIILAVLIISGCQTVEIIDNQHENISGLNDFEIIADSLTVPWEVSFLPSGELLVTERPGRILKIAADKKIIEVNGVRDIGEGGLLGLTIHPNYSDNRWIYIYFTVNQNGNVENRIERYALQNSSLSDTKVILSGIPGAANHDGGRISFGPDGKLYATTGDAGNEEFSQDTNSLAGKILRLNDDGSIPEDNPFGNAVYSYGHRNAQGLAWDDSGNLWATEHGSSGYDELNLIT